MVVVIRHHCIYRLLQIVLESPVLSDLPFLQGSIFDQGNTFADFCHAHSNGAVTDILYESV